MADENTGQRQAAEVRLDRLLGRRVLTTNNRPFGRIEEFRAEQRGTSLVVTEYLLGRGGLLERLHVGVRLLIGLRLSSYTVRSDQLDISDPRRPRLLCSIKELTR